MTDLEDLLSTDPRARELAERLRVVEERVQSACRDAGRDRGEVRLVVVTKFFPAADIVRLHDLGVREIGENKVQEASGKLAELPAEVRGDLTVHLVGQLQTNKARQAVALADLVHAVDRPKLVAALDRAGAAVDRVVDVLLQVNLDHVGDEAPAPGQGGGRGGEQPGAIPALAELVTAAEHLRLRGLMGVAPLDGDPQQAFAALAEVSGRLRDDHPEATIVSAGMSGDLEAAVANGATHLRVGSAILGRRPAPR